MEKDKDRHRTPQERIELLHFEKWCVRCGKHPDDKSNNCWAKSAQCYQCGQMGHLASLCLDDESPGEDSNKSECEGEDNVQADNPVGGGIADDSRNSDDGSEDHVEDDDTNEPGEEGSISSEDNNAVAEHEGDASHLGHPSVQDQDSKSSSSSGGSVGADDGNAGNDTNASLDDGSRDHIDGDAQDYCDDYQDDDYSDDDYSD